MLTISNLTAPCPLDPNQCILRTSLQGVSSSRRAVSSCHTDKSQRSLDFRQLAAERQSPLCPTSLVSIVGECYVHSAFPIVHIRRIYERGNSLGILPLFNPSLLPLHHLHLLLCFAITHALRASSPSHTHLIHSLSILCTELASATVLYTTIYHHFKSSTQPSQPIFSC